MKLYQALPIIFFTFTLANCQNDPSRTVHYNNNELYHLEDVTITSSHQRAQNYQLKAARAFGDTDLVKMERIKINGSDENNSYQLQVASGEFKTADLQGQLFDGISFSTSSGYHATTRTAFITKNSITTADQVQVYGPAIQLILDGASYNIDSRLLTSLHSSTGTISPATF